MLWAIAALLLATPAHADMPDGFVYLADIDATIKQDMRYAGRNNFTGAIVPGYDAAECVLAEPVARALSRVQKALAGQGRGLIVYDCYRPQRAVARFNRWARAGGAARDKEWHPNVARNRLVAEGYIGARSGHSSGGTVDLGLTGADGKVLDMGGPFDLFDPVSNTGARGLSAAARANRQQLVKAMAAGGFSNYRREWWHFSFRGEPFKGRAFDFVIEKR